MAERVEADTPAKDIFENGSSRTHIDERYDLLLPEFIRQMALTMGRGAGMHSADSAEVPNYQKGGPQFVRATINHLEKHLWRYKTGMGVPEEDDLVAVACGAMIAWWHQVVGGSDYRRRNDIRQTGEYSPTQSEEPATEKQSDEALVRSQGFLQPQTADDE